MESMRSRVPFVSSVLFGVLLVALPAGAQTSDRRGDVSVQVSVRSLHEFDETEAGFGARLSYRLSRWFAADGEVNFFPADVGSPAFSGSRLEGLAGGEDRLSALAAAGAGNRIGNETESKGERLGACARRPKMSTIPPAGGADCVQSDSLNVPLKSPSPEMRHDSFLKNSSRMRGNFTRDVTV